MKYGDECCFKYFFGRKNENITWKYRVDPVPDVSKKKHSRKRPPKVNNQIRANFTCDEEYVRIRGKRRKTYLPDSWNYNDSVGRYPNKLSWKRKKKHFQWL